MRSVKFLQEQDIKLLKSEFEIESNKKIELIGELNLKLKNLKAMHNESSSKNDLKDNEI